MPRDAVHDLAAGAVDAGGDGGDIGALVEVELLEFGVEPAQRLCGRGLRAVPARLDERREHPRGDALAGDVRQKPHRLAVHLVDVGQVPADLAAGDIHEGIVRRRAVSRGREQPLLDVLRGIHLARDLRLVGVVHDAEIKLAERRDADPEGEVALAPAHDEFAEGAPAVLHGVRKERTDGAVGAAHALAAHFLRSAARRLLERPLGLCGAEALAEGAVGVAHLHIFIHDDRRRGDIVEHAPVKVHAHLPAAVTCRNTF